MSGPVHVPGEVDLIDPVPVDLGDEIVAGGRRERAVRTTEGGRRVVCAVPGDTELPRDCLRGGDTTTTRQFLMSAVTRSPFASIIASSGFHTYPGPEPCTPG